MYIPEGEETNTMYRDGSLLVSASRDDAAKTTRQRESQRHGCTKKFKHLKDSVDALEDKLGSKRRRLCVQQTVVEKRKEVFPVLVSGYGGFQIGTWQAKTDGVNECFWDRRKKRQVRWFHNFCAFHLSWAFLQIHTRHEQQQPAT